MNAWKPRDDIKLTRMHYARLSSKEIADILNRTEYAIIHRKKKLGLQRILNDDACNIVRRKKRKTKEL